MSIQTNNKKRQITRNGNGNPEPIVGDRGAYIMGPRNVPIERQNPDALIAPATDAGTVPNFKWPFALSHNRVLSGGWARETTTRELPISTEIAGVNMRLKPGGIRELHWHKESEWGYVIKGSCRVSLFDEEGRSLSTTSAPATFGTSPPGCRIRSKLSRTGSSSCSSLTAATSQRTRHS
jgi:oxalate decarboxylase